MADRHIKAGTTDVTIMVRMFDAYTGAPATGLTIANIDVNIYRLDDDNDVEAVQGWTALTAHNALTDAHADNYGYEMASGFYRIDLPNGACQAGSPSGVETVVLVRDPTATELCLEVAYRIQLELVSVDVIEVGGTAQTANDNGADINAILVDTAEIGAAGAGLTDLGGMSTGMKAEVEAEANDALVALNLDHLMKVAVGNRTDMTTEVVDDTVLANLMTKTDGDTSDFDPTVDSLEAIAEDTTFCAGKIGTPANIDGKGATLADNINALSSDAGTFDATTDSLEAIRDNMATIDTWAIQTTVDNGDTAFSFTLTAGVAVNDAYNGMAISIIDADDSHAEVRRIVDYTSGLVVTVDRAFGFTPAAGDVVKLSEVAYPGPNMARGALEITYTVKEDDGNGDPIDGVEVWITTDAGGTNVIWSGTTDTNGILREAGDAKPWLDAGTYHFWRKKAGYTFTNPDSETFS
tara:strand:+ start:3635 stop:5029 length:1395 start_codon:yes stop_codon:yes gene_type:complete